MDNALIDGASLKSCYRCGKCTSGCEVNRIDPSFQPHRLLQLIARGAVDELIDGDAIWKCTTCFTCAERCPQGIAVTDILWSLRALAFRSCRNSGLLEAQKAALFKTGRLYPVTGLDHKKREKAGLPPLAENATLISRIFDAAKAGG
ncbi:MAG: 4Fe-4S dicluster domain-containing protein [Pseudomonadota bacterium]